MSDTQSREPQSVPELLRIMDVASALRRERERAERELEIDETKERLRARLRAAATESGDPVSEAEIETAIDHYFRSQFEFVEPKAGVRKLVAHAWIRRGRIALAAAAVVVLGVAVWFGVFSRSAPLSSAARAERALADAAAPLQASVARLRALATDDPARDAVEQVARDADAVRGRSDLVGMARITEQAKALERQLNSEYVIRVVSRAGEKSGVDAYYEDESGKRLSGYYLVVEAIGSAGVITMSIDDAETQTKVQVRKWGEQVPKAVYDRIAADKKADGIVDDATFARKVRGHLRETVEMLGEDQHSPLTRGRKISGSL